MGCKVKALYRLVRGIRLYTCISCLMYVRNAKNYKNVKHVKDIKKEFSHLRSMSVFPPLQKCLPFYRRNLKTGQAVKEEPFFLQRFTSI